jgi:hypothetical protein
MPPEVAVSKNFGSRIFDFEPQDSSQAYKLDNQFATKKTHEVGESFGTEGVQFHT